MLDVLTMATVSVAAFVATSIDNLLVLSGLLAVSATGRTRVLAGYLVATVVVLGLSWAIARIGDFIPVDYLGFLGLVPLAMGVFQLRAQQRADQAPEEGTPRSSAAPGVVTTAMTFLALSSDSVAVLVPLLAESPARLDVVILGVGAGMALLWFWVGQIAVAHPTWQAYVRRLGPRLVPYLLIAIGLYVLADTPTDRLTAVLISAQADAPQLSEFLTHTVDVVTGTSSRLLI